MPPSRPSPRNKSRATSKKVKKFQKKTGKSVRKKGAKFTFQGKNKGFDHKYELEIKKKLIQFVKEEYRQKKPREIRLMKMKPKTVFKRGTMLPNIMIRTMDQTAFIISLDFGEEVRFYLIDGNGNSLGASTMENSEKIHKELHGKVITLYHLPKVSNQSQFDEKSVALNAQFKNKIHSFQKMWGKPLGSVRTISLAKKNVKSGFPRIGVQKEGNILHFDPNFLDKLEFKVIWLREIFTVFWNLTENIAGEIILATFWALTQSSLSERQEYLKRWKEQGAAETNESDKSAEFLLQERMLSLFSFQEYNQEIKTWENLGNYILAFTAFHQRKRFLTTFKLINPLLFFLTELRSERKEGLNFSLISEDIISERNAAKITLNLLYFLYNHPDLVEKHRIMPLELYHSFYLWVLFFSLKISLILSESERKIVDIPTPPKNSGTTLDLINECVECWNEWRWQELFDKIEMDLDGDSENRAMVEFLSDNLLKCFEKFGFKLIYPPHSMPPLIIGENNGMELKITLENRTDIVFTQAEYSFELIPEKNFSAEFIETPHASIFDTQITFKVKLFRKNSKKKHKLRIWGNFNHPLAFTSDSKEKRKVCLFSTEIN